MDHTVIHPRGTDVPQNPCIECKGSIHNAMFNTRYTYSDEEHDDVKDSYFSCVHGHYFHYLCFKGKCTGPLDDYLRFELKMDNESIEQILGIWNKTYYQGSQGTWCPQCLLETIRKRSANFTDDHGLIVPEMLRSYLESGQDNEHMSVRFFFTPSNLRKRTNNSQEG